MINTGRIMKGIAGFYYVLMNDKLYECKAKGKFRNQKIKPLVGDLVNIEIVDEEAAIGNIIEILPRMAELIRPAVSNIDQIILVFSADCPEPNRNLIDRFLVMMSAQGMKVILCVSKCDLIDERIQARIDTLVADYALAGYEMIQISTKKEHGLDSIKEVLRGHQSALAGPSGVGKSTLLNALVRESLMETGDISKKIQRGKHTTRHSELFFVPLSDTESAILIDTPGFATVYIDMVEAQELEQHFHEFSEFLEHCRYMGCAHIKERDCAVRSALNDGKISLSRYENYCAFYEERKNARRY